MLSEEQKTILGKIGRRIVDLRGKYFFELDDIVDQTDSEKTHDYHVKLDTIDDVVTILNGISDEVLSQENNISKENNISQGNSKVVEHNDKIEQNNKTVLCPMCFKEILV